MLAAVPAPGIKHGALCASLCACLLAVTAALSSCPAGTQGGAETSQNPPSKTGAAATPASMANAAPREVILLYTGDTVSAVEPNRSYKPPEGGLPALGNAIHEYEEQILEYNQARVANEGGDATKITADSAASMLGDHPLILLDYGGWERPNDPQGWAYITRWFAFVNVMHYSVIASSAWDTMSADAWSVVRRLPGIFAPLATTGQRTMKDIVPMKIWKSEQLGERWGIVSIPDFTDAELKDTSGKVWKARIDTAAQTLKDADSKVGVLIAPGLPRAAWDALKSDTRFTVVIGCPAGIEAAQGTGVPLPQNGPLLLPMLFGGGRQLGACHLICTDKGSIPVEYTFILKQVVDDESKPYPYREQCKEAVKLHDAKNPAAAPATK